jgi:hypothetical protein
LPEQYIDGIMGSQELLHYDIDDAVICPPTQADWDEKKFHGFVKSDLVQKLGVSSNTFADALLMIGTSFLPPFPPLEAPLTRQPFTIMEAINQLRTSNKSITSACTSFSDILQQRDPRWLEKFQKAQMGIRHCATVKVNGEIHIKDKDGLTQDNADYLGLQLPPELYHYLVKGVVGPRLMNYFGALEFLVYPTLDGVLSEEYKRLVTKTLPPIKTTTAALVAPNLHRGFHFKAIKMKYWFDDTLKDELVHKDEHQESNQKANTWAVRDTQLKDLESSTSTLGGSLSFAVLSLQNKEFPKKSIFKEKKITGLKSKSEVTSNAIWRLLHLRGYVNDQHELTIWGNALATTLKCIEPSVKKYEDIHHVQEAAFLAYELLRFDNLNSRNRHPELIGGALRGSDEDKANCMLIGRTACLLMVRHKLIGYTGPLSKNFLSFYSIIKAVRETDRDLLEAITASMLLGNQINRDRDDLESIGAR